MKTELVPLNYGREAWNCVYDANLTTHNSLLTKDQAELINSQYDVILLLGDHGIARQEASYDHEVPTQFEYAMMAKRIESMRPGDALFVEKTGFSRQFSAPEAPEYPKPKGLQRWLGKIGLARVPKDPRLPQLYRERANYRLSLWGLAERQAAIQGNPVMHADIDAFLEASLLQGRDLETLYRSGNEADARFLKDVDLLRAKAARNILKDWALSNARADFKPGERKRQLIVPFGEFHSEDLQQVCAEIGINVRIEKIYNSTAHARQGEQLRLRRGPPSTGVWRPL